MRVAILLVLGLFLISVFAITIQIAAATEPVSPYWTERMPIDDGDHSWHAVEISGDGSKAIAAVYGGRLYHSLNSGATWSELQPAGDTNKDWRTVAISNDGSVLVAAVLGGHVYVSQDSGETWTERRPSGILPRQWTSATVSDDGAKIAVSSWGAGIVPGRVYISTNSGATWNETQPTGGSSSRWARIEMSGNGNVLLAGRSDGRLYLSTNSGETWNETQPAGDQNGTWYALAVNGNGSRLVAASSGGRVYISTNSGETWNETQPAGDVDRGWTSASIDNQGNKILIGTGVEDRNGLFVSENFGTSWRESHPAGPEYDGSWRTAVSNDGTKVITASYNGRLFTGYFWNQVPLTDVNNDGIPDSEQAHVQALVNGHTGNTVGLELDENCSIQTLSIAQESSANVQDIGYDYAEGLMSFTADCGEEGYTTSVTLYFYGVQSDNVVVRKHNPHTNAYFTVENASLSEQTINSQLASVVTYEIKDGGSLDIDGLENGIIVDPVGLASQVLNVPNTGLGGSR